MSTSTQTLPALSFLMTVATNKPTTDGALGIFAVAPSDGLPSGVAINDIAFLQSGTWKSLYKTGSPLLPPAVLYNGNTYILSGGVWAQVGFSGITTANIDAWFAPYESLWVSATRGNDTTGTGTKSNPFATRQHAINSFTAGSPHTIYVEGNTTDTLVFRTNDQSMRIITEAKSNHTGAITFVATNTSIYFDSIGGLASYHNVTINNAANGTIYFDCDLTGSTINETGTAGYTEIGFNSLIDGVTINLTGNRTIRPLGPGSAVVLNQSKGLFDGSFKGSITTNITGSSTTSMATILREGCQLLKDTNGKSLICSATPTQPSVVYLIGCSTYQSDGTYGKIDFTGAGANMLCYTWVHTQLAASGDVFPPTGVQLANSAMYLAASRTATNYTAASASVKGHLDGIDTKLGTKAALISSPTNGDIATTNGSGQPIDSGVSISTTATDNVDTKVLTAKATHTAITNFGSVVYQGTWNASTNTPTLANGVGTKGYQYKVSVAGTTTIDGNSQWNVGDQIVFNGTTWDKIDGVSSEVLSVAGRSGAVVLSTIDTLPVVTTQTAAFTAVASTEYPVNTTSAAITATLPASPSAGAQVVFDDYAGTFATNNLTINPNGSKINGSVSNYIASTNRQRVIAIYVDATQGWTIGASGGGSSIFTLADIASQSVPLGTTAIVAPAGMTMSSTLTNGAAFVAGLAIPFINQSNYTHNICGVTINIYQSGLLTTTGTAIWLLNAPTSKPVAQLSHGFTVGQVYHVIASGNASGNATTQGTSNGDATYGPYRKGDASNAYLITSRGICIATDANNYVVSNNVLLPVLDNNALIDQTVQTFRAVLNAANAITPNTTILLRADPLNPGGFISGIPTGPSTGYNLYVGQIGTDGVKFDFALGTPIQSTAASQFNAGKRFAVNSGPYTTDANGTKVPNILQRASATLLTCNFSDGTASQTLLKTHNGTQQALTSNLTYNIATSAFSSYTGTLVFLMDYSSGAPVLVAQPIANILETSGQPALTTAGQYATCKDPLQGFKYTTSQVGAEFVLLGQATLSGGTITSGTVINYAFDASYFATLPAIGTSATVAIPANIGSTDVTVSGVFNNVTGSGGGGIANGSGGYRIGDGLYDGYSAGHYRSAFYISNLNTITINTGSAAIYHGVAPYSYFTGATPTIFVQRNYG